MRLNLIVEAAPPSGAAQPPARWRQAQAATTARLARRWRHQRVPVLVLLRQLPTAPCGVATWWERTSEMPTQGLYVMEARALHPQVVVERARWTTATKHFAIDPLPPETQRPTLSISVER